MVGRARGYTLIEVVCAMAVLTIVSTAVLTGERGQLAGVRQSVDDLAASRAAAARLEEYHASDPLLITGRRVFPVGLAGCRGIEEVRRVTSGLFEVTVTVRRGDADLARLTTLVATEESE